MWGHRRRSPPPSIRDTERPHLGGWRSAGSSRVRGQAVLDDVARVVELLDDPARVDRADGPGRCPAVPRSGRNRRRSAPAPGAGSLSCARAGRRRTGCPPPERETAVAPVHQQRPWQGSSRPAPGFVIRAGPPRDAARGPLHNQAVKRTWGKAARVERLPSPTSATRRGFRRKSRILAPRPTRCASETGGFRVRGLPEPRVVPTYPLD